MLNQTRGKLDAVDTLGGGKRSRKSRRQRIAESFERQGRTVFVERRTVRYPDIHAFATSRASKWDGRPYAQLFPGDVVLITLPDLLSLIGMHRPKPPMAERRVQKATNYKEWIFGYLAALPQYPRYKRVKTAKEVARYLKLELELVRKVLKELVQEGMAMRDHCSLGDGYAVAYKE